MSVAITAIEALGLDVSNGTLFLPTNGALLAYLEDAGIVDLEAALADAETS